MKYIALFYFLNSIALSETKLEFCIWAKIQTITTESSIDSLVNFAKKNQYSTIFAQVRSRGEAAYESRIISKYQRVFPLTFDPLNYLINKAHSVGIEVHAWLNMYVIWTRYKMPVPSDHIFNQSDWIDNHFNGLKGNKNIYLSPIHPEVNNYLLGIIDELISNYNVDGIHLDYMRFKDKDYGFNNDGLLAFSNQQKIKTSIVELKKSIPNDLKRDWEKFKKNAITSLLKRTAIILKWRNPSMLLSVAVKPNLIEAKSRFYQDWGLWLKQGLLDFVVPMNYYSEKEIFIRDLKLMKSRLPEPIHTKIIMGIGCYNQNSKSASEKIKLVISNGFGGVSLFAYDTHKHNPSWFDILHKTMN